MATLLLDMNIHREKLEAALLAVDRQTVMDVLTFPHSDLTTEQSLEELVVPVLERIGEGWETGEYSLSQVYMSGKICEDLIDNILPLS
ncbi:MAG: B12-binding domain-containing protein [Anaerolineales bacterium]|nr:B12-binding domain-containing protein [Anaerolineales bacterium]